MYYSAFTVGMLGVGYSMVSLIKVRIPTALIRHALTILYRVNLLQSRFVVVS